MMRPCLQGCRKGRQRLIAAAPALMQCFPTIRVSAAPERAAGLASNGYDRRREAGEDQGNERFRSLIFTATFPLHVRGLVRRNEVGFIGSCGYRRRPRGSWWRGAPRRRELLHLWLFGHPHLSNLFALDRPNPGAGSARGRSRFSAFPGFTFESGCQARPVDPIEANALHGGRMSLKDSALIAAQTVISNGFGASVGLEAAYTQMGSGFASWLGSGVPAAAQRHAHPCRLRFGWCDRRGLRRPADRRLLCVRADFGDLYAVRSGPGRRGGDLRGAGLPAFGHQRRIHGP